MKDKISIDNKKIHKFMRELNEAEFLYVSHIMDFVSSLKHMIKRHKLSKEQFCTLFDIKPSQYKNYTSGSYNYSMMDFAKLNANHYTLEMKLIAENPPIQCPPKEVS